LIADKSADGKLHISFDGLGIFGEPESARVIYMKLKEEGPQFELLQEIVHLLISNSLKSKILDESELSHIKYNKDTEKWQLNQLHLTLMNGIHGKHQLIKMHGKSEFDAKDILDTHMGNFNFDEIKANTVQLLQRFHYDEKTGFYVSQYTIDI
jgi:hypothetical protein